MVVVADASPINYLALIGELELLKSLYGRILIPRAVMNELRHPSAPSLVATFASDPPNWIEAIEIEVRDPIPELDPGETAAIALAELYPDSLLLIDEAAGRAEAGRRRIAFTGTLGILRDASTAGLVNLRFAIAKLQATSFRMPIRAVAELLAGDETSMRRWNEPPPPQE